MAKKKTTKKVKVKKEKIIKEDKDLLTSGKKITRPIFEEGVYFYFKEGVFYNQRDEAVLLGTREKLADDWVVVK